MSDPRIDYEQDDDSDWWAWVDQDFRQIFEYTQEREMDRSKFNPSGGNSSDLKAADFLGKSFKLTVERIDTVIYNEGEPTEQRKTVLYFVGKDKRLVLNATNNETLCTAYGNDDNEWIGKEVSLSTKEYSAEGFPPGWIIAALDPDFSDDIPFALVLPTLLGAAMAAQQVAILVA